MSVFSQKHTTHTTHLYPPPPIAAAAAAAATKNMMSASEASDENTIEYGNVQALNFEDGVQDIQNQVSHFVGTATTQAPRPWW